MPSIEIVKDFNQYYFESSSSEQEIVLIKSKWDSWKTVDEFADACLDHAWGKREMKKKIHGFFVEFVKDISVSLKEKRTFRCRTALANLRWYATTGIPRL